MVQRIQDALEFVDRTKSLSTRGAALVPDLNVQTGNGTRDMCLGILCLDFESLKVSSRVKNIRRNGAW